MSVLEQLKHKTQSLLYIYVYIYVYTYVCTVYQSIEVTELCKRRICSRSLAGIMGSNPARAWMSSVLSVLCSQVEVSATGRSLDRSGRNNNDVSLCMIFSP